MIKMLDVGTVRRGPDHVAFRVRRPVALAELRVGGGLVAVLIAAIGVCGSVLPPRSGWLQALPAANAVTGHLSVGDGLQGAARPASDQG